MLLALVFVVEALSTLYLTTKMTVLPAIVERSRLPANQIGLAVAFAPPPFSAAAAAATSWLAGLLDRLELARVSPTTAALLLNAATFLLAAAIIWRPWDPLWLCVSHGCRAKRQRQREPGPLPVRSARASASRG